MDNEPHSQEIGFTTLANFQDKQREAWEKLFDPACKYLLYGGAAGGGKSYFLRWAAVGLAIYYASKYGVKGVPIGLFSEDYPTLKDRQVSRIKREFPPWLGSLRETRDEGFIFQLADQYGAGVILLRNLDDPSKYASTEFAAECVEEATKNNEQTFEDLRFRLRYPGIPDSKFVAASNPGSIGHGWVKKYFITQNAGLGEREQDRFFYIPARVADNAYIDQAYVHQLESLPEAKRKAYLEGSWDVFAGQYFTEWGSLHIAEPFIPDRHDLIVGGMDWGRTKPFSFHLAQIKQVTFNEVKFYRSTVFFEVYGTERTPKEWAGVIKSELKRFKLAPFDINWIRGDPAMFTKGQDLSISIADQFKREGIWIKPASNDRLGGWENLHNWFSLAPDGLPYLQTTRNCKAAIRTIPELVHDEVRMEDVDTQGEDHAGDSYRYMHKHLKWVDARVGGVMYQEQGEHKKAVNIAANIDLKTGKQVAIDLDKWASPHKSRVYYKGN